MVQTLITNLSLAELANLMESWGEPAFRAHQVWGWVYQSLASSFEEMSNLPQRLRQSLAQELYLTSLVPIQEVRSANSQTTGTSTTKKVLFQLNDGKTIETVFLYHKGTYHPGIGIVKKERQTVCVSTQVGCSISCPFCATGQQPFERNLTTGEIVEQVLYFARKKHKITNVVFMGMGEPLANYDATLKAIRILNSSQGFHLGARHFTLSTAGLVPQINQLAKEDVQVGLAVSLHAADNALRDKLVPINKRYPLETLIEACQNYINSTGRRVTFEYILFNGINDSVKQARKLSSLVTGMNCHVNLIPTNPTGNKRFSPPLPENAAAFQMELEHHYITTTLRRSMGADIHAGCGQLRSHYNCEEPSKILCSISSKPGE